ncbi:NlpC/P60 family protein [Kamptonema cortianum]|nr:NlpC/P60 family protein [Geitlerinema splendidum]MDK3158405.1 NlpC/P60 family protein [Kamptonema cortianum]
MLAATLATGIGQAVAQGMTVGVIVPAPKPAPAKTTTHTVQKGENDWSIAKKHGITVSELHKLNPNTNWQKLQIGAKLKVPAKNAPAAKPKAQPVKTIPGKTVKIIKDDVIIRSGPSTSNSQVTKVAKGRTANLIESRNGWHKIQFSGGTIGWVRGDMATVVSTSNSAPAKPAVAKPADKPNNGVVTTGLPLRVKITGDDVNIRKWPDPKSGRLVQVTKGRIADVLGKKNGWYKVKFSGGTIGWVHADYAAPAGANDTEEALMALAAEEKKLADAKAGTKAEALLDTASDQMGIRYRYGGTSRNGFDCSGFVSYVFSKHGISLPRTSLAQSQYGTKVSSRSQLQPGDLVFFITRGSRVSHVGIYIGNSKFIHASSGGGRVQINSLNDAYYNKRYAGARRIGKLGATIVDQARNELGQLAIPEGPDPVEKPLSDSPTPRLEG